ncbi:hypothetical protein FN846DRAFT_917539 [Sphaerosporella brunnea]|uniref:Uncharacterized protein n=1 Tax=Sphaerosporella brunnea TaxID=1250544 RepID=A0A5J5F3H3_9PEZI|nr:hypothetical protein FN846DRAFT_917539 [Sphaerosporella brunnea]
MIMTVFGFGSLRLRYYDFETLGSGRTGQRVHEQAKAWTVKVAGLITSATAKAAGKCSKVSTETAKPWLIAATIGVLLTADKAIRTFSAVSISFADATRNTSTRLWRGMLAPQILSATITTLLAVNSGFQVASAVSQAAIPWLTNRWATWTQKAATTPQHSQHFFLALTITALFSLHNMLERIAAASRRAAEATKAVCVPLLQQFDDIVRSVESRIDWWRAGPQPSGRLCSRAVAFLDKTASKLCAFLAAKTQACLAGMRVVWAAAVNRSKSSSSGSDGDTSTGLPRYTTGEREHELEQGGGI